MTAVELRYFGVANVNESSLRDISHGVNAKPVRNNVSATRYFAAGADQHHHAAFL